MAKKRVVLAIPVGFDDTVIDTASVAEALAAIIDRGLTFNVVEGVELPIGSRIQVGTPVVSRQNPERLNVVDCTFDCFDNDADQSPTRLPILSFRVQEDNYGAHITATARNGRDLGWVALDYFSNKLRVCAAQDESQDPSVAYLQEDVAAIARLPQEV